MWVRTGSSFCRSLVSIDWAGGSGRGVPGYINNALSNVLLVIILRSKRALTQAFSCPTRSTNTSNNHRCGTHFPTATTSMVVALSSIAVSVCGSLRRRSMSNGVVRTSTTSTMQAALGWRLLNLTKKSISRLCWRRPLAVSWKVWLYQEEKIPSAG